MTGPDTTAGRRQAARRRGGRPDRASAAQLTAAIVEAARAEFLSRGFGAARMDAIAKGAGTTKQTLYGRFGSKEALFIAVSSDFLQRRFTAPIIAQGSDVRIRLVDLADQMLAAMLDPHMVRMYSIILSEAHRFPELARLSEEDQSFPARDMIREILTEEAGEGRLDIPDPHRAMLMLQHMIIAHPLRMAQLGLESAPAMQREWARYAIDIFLRGANHQP